MNGWINPGIRWIQHNLIIKYGTYTGTIARNNSLLKKIKVRRYDFLVKGLEAEREPVQIRKDYDIYRYLSVSDHKIYFLLMHAQKPSILDIPVGSVWTLFTQAVLRSRIYFFRLRLHRAENPNFGSSSGSGSSPGSRQFYKILHKDKHERSVVLMIRSHSSLKC